jgi:hypothetical protein
MKNKLQRIIVTEKEYQTFLRILTAHEDVVVATPREDKARVKLMPSRRGRVYGNGQEKLKEPIYPLRAKVEFTIAFKGDLARSKALTI